MSNIKVFLCYHHNPKDEPLVEELKTRLKSLKSLGLINVVWHDQLVEPGLEPESEIDKHLSSAQIILLLISPDFIASDVYDRSVKPALLRQEREEARVIPIILRPTSWQEAPFIKLQVLPSNRKPVTLWSNSDEAWLDVEEGIKSAAESIRKNVGDDLLDPSRGESSMIPNTIVSAPGNSEDVTGKSPHNLPAAVEYSTVLVMKQPVFDFTPVRTIVEHFGPVATVAFSPDGEHLVSDSSDKKIKIWNRLASHSLLTFPSRAEAVYSVVFSPDNRSLASGSDDGKINIWDAQNGRLVQTLASHAEPIASVAYGPSMKVMSGSEDGVIKIWNISGGTLNKTLRGHKCPISSIALSTDGKILVSGSYDMSVMVWNTFTGELLKTLQGHTEAVSSVALSTDGKLLASGSHDKTVKVWDISTGSVLKTLRGHTKTVSSVALSTDGKLLVSGSHDTTLKIWDVSTGEILKECPGHTKEVLSVAIHPNGQIIASGSYDKTIKIWQTPSVPAPASWGPLTVNPTGTEFSSSKSPFLDGSVSTSVYVVQDNFKQRIRNFLDPRFRYKGSPLFILGIIANILGTICIGVWLGRVAPSYGNETAWLWCIISLVSAEGAWWLFSYSGNKSVKSLLSLVLAIFWGFVGKAFATLIGAGGSISFLPDANIMFVIFCLSGLALHLRLTFRRRK